MRKNKKIVSFMLCLTLLLAMSATAFAAPLEPISGTNASRAYDITLWNHTDVVMRSQPTISASKVHTLYIGDTVRIITWQVSDTPTDGYYWANVSHTHASNGAYYVGYSANEFLS